MADNARIDTLVSTLIMAGKERHYQGTWYSHTYTYEGKKPWQQMTAGDFLDEKCGTTACAAGWAKVLFMDKDKCIVEEEAPYGFARKVLGLTPGQASVLFLDFASREAVIAGLKYIKDHPDASEYELQQNEVTRKYEEKQDA